MNQRGKFDAMLQRLTALLKRSANPPIVDNLPIWLLLQYRLGQFSEEDTLLFGVLDKEIGKEEAEKAFADALIASGRYLTNEKQEIVRIERARN